MIAVENAVREADRSPEVFTIGHDALPIGHFVELLRSAGVTLLVDIRRYPGSRHSPWFNPEELRAVLEALDIGYLPLEALGGRRKPCADSLNTSWRNFSFRGYADYMETGEFRRGLSDLIELARTQCVAIMCAETVWWRCHRALVSDALMVNGFQVWHIMSDGSRRPHHLTQPARIVDGVLTYHDSIA